MSGYNPAGSYNTSDWQQETATQTACASKQYHGTIDHLQQQWSDVASGGLSGYANAQHLAKSQQAAAYATLPTPVDSLQSDTDGIVKRSYSIRSQIDQIYDLLFGPSPEVGTPQEGHVSSIQGDLKHSYDVLSGVDARLGALLARLGGR